MKLINTQITNHTKASLNASFRQHLLAFVNRHADTFDALARNTGLFGTNWLPAGHNRIDDELDGRS